MNVVQRLRGGRAGAEHIDRDAAAIRARIGNGALANDRAVGRHDGIRGAEQIRLRDLVRHHEAPVGAPVLVVSVPAPAVAKLAFQAGEGVIRTVVAVGLDAAPRLRHDVEHEAGHIERRHPRLQRGGNEGVAAENRERTSGIEIGRCLRIGRRAVAPCKLRECFDVARDVVRQVRETDLGVDRSQEVHRVGVEGRVASPADLEVGRALCAVDERLGNSAWAETDALRGRGQRSGVDHTAISSVRLRNVTGDRLPRVGRRLVDRSDSRERDEHAMIVGPVALGGVSGLRVAPIERGDHVQAIVHEGRAPGHRGLVVTRVAAAGRTRTRVHLQSGEARVEDEVRDTGDRVRSVGRGSAAGHDADVGDQRLGQRVDVDVAGEIGRRHAPAVEQHQVARRPEVSQVQEASRTGARGAADRFRRGGG